MGVQKFTNDVNHFKTMFLFLLSGQILKIELQ